jgi:probable rRNA maturation factor
LKDFFFFLFASEKKLVEKVDIIFCSAQHLLKLNKKHLNHNYHTDTLTFLLSNKGEAIVGEVYLSISQIRKNAKVYQSSYQKELLRVMIHGCLHLCGYKDKPESGARKMERKQEKYLLRWYVSRETKLVKESA